MQRSRLQNKFKNSINIRRKTIKQGLTVHSAAPSIIMKYLTLIKSKVFSNAFNRYEKVKIFIFITFQRRKLHGKDYIIRRIMLKQFLHLISICIYIYISFYYH